MPKIIVVNGWKCICDETAFESIYSEKDKVMSLTKKDWEKLEEELKK